MWTRVPGNVSAAKGQQELGRVGVEGVGGWTPNHPSQSWKTRDPRGLGVPLASWSLSFLICPLSLIITSAQATPGSGLSHNKPVG